jgi:hypothetical protein
MKEWKITVGSTAVAREFAEVVDQVRKKEKIRKVVKKDVVTGNKVNLSVTPFVEEIQMLEKGDDRQKMEKREEAGGVEMKEEKKKDLLDVLVPQ